MGLQERRRLKIGDGTGKWQDEVERPEDFTLQERPGDLIETPDIHAILIHSVNCQGVWGHGVADALREAQPDAFTRYKNHCQKSATELLGTCLVIPPSKIVDNPKPTWVACLFVSNHYGRRKSKGKDIDTHTKQALADLRKQVEERFPSPPMLWAPRINAGAFGRKWENTKKIIEEVFAGSRLSMTILTLEE